MASKIRRWLRELAVWLLIGAAVSPAVDYFRQPALPQNVSATSLQTLDGRTLDLNAISQQKPLLLYVWATGAEFVAIPRRRWYRLPPTAAMC